MSMLLLSTIDKIYPPSPPSTNCPSLCVPLNCGCWHSNKIQEICQTRHLHSFVLYRYYLVTYYADIIFSFIIQILSSHSLYRNYLVTYYTDIIFSFIMQISSSQLSYRYYLVAYYTGIFLSLIIQISSCSLLYRYYLLSSIIL